MAKQDFEILGGLKIGSVLAFDSLAQIQHTAVGLAEVAKQGTISSLTDVNLSGIQNGQVLKWDGNQFGPANDSDTFLTGITSASNTALGVDAFSTGGGTDNVAIGHSSLKLSTGSSNIAIGDDAGSALVSGDQNVIIGRIDGSTIEGKDGQMIMANGAGTLIMSADSAQKVSMVGDVDVATVLTFGSTTETTDKITEGSNNLYWQESRFNASFLAKTTDSLSEGSSNYYYTEGRFNTSLAAKTTDSLTEGSDNLYYTEDRVNTNFAAKTTDSLSEGVNPSRYYWTEGRFNTSFLAKTTDSLTEGVNNLYYTDERARSAARTSTIVAGTGVTYDAATGTISIGQDVDSDADVKFGSVNIDDVVVMDTQETAANASAVVISSIASADFRSMRVTIQASHDTDFHTSEMLVLHDGTDVLTTEFGAIKTSGAALATFSAAINNGNVEITATPVGGIDPTYKIVRHSTKV